MDFLADSQFWAKWIRIVILDLCLAGDNALVIALAVHSLPAKQQFWGRMGGTAGAVILRIAFVGIVSWLMMIPALRLVGGLALIWIAFKLVRGSDEGGEKVKHGTSLKEAIGIIICADVVMSLDNVLAIAGAAQGDMRLVIFGLLLSLPLVVWGSGLLARLMNRFPVIIWIGGGVLGYVAMEMILKDDIMIRWLGAAVAHTLHHILPWVLGLFICAVGWWLARSVKAAGAGDQATP